MEWQIMEAPTLCEQCGEWFDLFDGKSSPRKPRTIICEGCADREEKQIEEEEEIQELKDEIADAEDTIKRNTLRLQELGQSVATAPQ